MTLHQFINKYNHIDISKYQITLLTKCFDKLNAKYDHDALIEQDSLYLTIKYIFDHKIIYILDILPESYIYELHSDTISSIVNIYSSNPKSIDLLLSICGTNIILFAKYCLAIQYLNQSENLDLNNISLIQFVCNCFEYDKNYEVIKNVISMHLKVDKLNEFYITNQKEFIKIIELNDIESLIKLTH